MTTQAEHSPLGKKVDYQDHYAPSLLFPIERAGKRAEIAIEEQALPFGGIDIWNGYELSWLNARGKPQVAIATFTLPASSPCLIESKSFKLYLNSFNQTRLPDTATLQQRLQQDLSQAAGAAVSVTLTLPAQFASCRLAELEGEYIDDLDIDVEHYTPDPTRLRADPADQVCETLCSNLLKSNCTDQLSWGPYRPGKPAALPDRISPAQ